MSDTTSKRVEEIRENIKNWHISTQLSLARDAAFLLDELDRSNKLLEIATEALTKAEDFLNADIAMLPCESRQRDLPEDTWEQAMFIRDELSKALEKIKARGV